MRFDLAIVMIGIALSVRAGCTPIPGPMPTVNPAAACVVAPDFEPELMASDSSDAADPAAELIDAPDGSQTAPGGDSAGQGSSTSGQSNSAAGRADSGSPAPGSGSTGQNAGARPAPNPDDPVDANGNPIPIERQEPKRILGFMPNFRTVSGGAKPHPPGWKYNFTVATRQATDYSSFIFLGLTSLSAEGIDEHPALGHGARGFYAYTWRGFLDKSDNTYLSAWLLASTLHEDTRFYALGNERSIFVRELYVISREGVAKTYGGHQTPNIAGLGGKVLTQIISRQYYPKSATTFPVLAEKFGYSVMRDVIFTSIREFYPDAAAHFIRRHREKMAAKAAAKDAAH